MLDVATLAVSLSRLGKRQKRRKQMRSLRALATSSSASPSSSASAPSSSFDPDATALTVMHTLSGSVALPSLPSSSSFSLSASSIDGEGEARVAPPPPAFAVCVGPDCSRRGSQEVAAQLALAEALGQRDSGGPSRQVVRCGCLGECGGRKGRLARGGTAGKVEVAEVEEATALERSLAPLV